jgi:hypothetical protein
MRELPNVPRQMEGMAVDVSLVPTRSQLWRGDEALVGQEHTEKTLDVISEEFKIQKFS